MRAPGCPRPRSLIPAALAAGAAAAPAADAAKNLEIGIADDAAVLEPGPRPRRRDGRRLAGASASTTCACSPSGGDQPAARATARAPAGFDAADPDAPGYDWSALDRAVALVRGARHGRDAPVTGPGPAVGDRDAVAAQPALNPVPDAVRPLRARRRDPLRGAGRPLHPLERAEPAAVAAAAVHVPRADVHARVARTSTAASSAPPAGDPRGRPGRAVLIGALAPSRPEPALAQRDDAPAHVPAGARVRRPRARSAIRRGPCARLPARAAADGFAYHPHGVRRAPDARGPNADDAGLADLGRLEALLDAVQRAGGLRNALGRTRRFDLYLTEYGYQTDPPDRFAGVRPGQQARGCSRARTWRGATRACATMTQYVWRDERAGPNGAGWQSGLRFADDRPKPALRSFPQPFWADRTVRGARRGSGGRCGRAARTRGVQRRRPAPPAGRRSAACAPTAAASSRCGSR